MPGSAELRQKPLGGRLNSTDSSTFCFVSAEKKLALFQLKMQEFRQEIVAERRAAKKGRVDTQKGFAANAKNLADMFDKLSKLDFTPSCGNALTFAAI